MMTANVKDYNVKNNEEEVKNFQRYHGGSI